MEQDYVREVMAYVHEKISEARKTGEPLGIDNYGDITDIGHPLKKLESALTEVFTYVELNPCCEIEFLPYK